MISIEWNLLSFIRTRVCCTSELLREEEGEGEEVASLILTTSDAVDALMLRSFRGNVSRKCLKKLARSC